MERPTTIWNRKFILLFITNLLVLAAFYAAIPIIPVYCQEIGITGSKIGIVLTAMSVATILFRPVAGYLLDNFNRYRVYLIFLALFCLSFPAFIAFPVFGLLIVVRLYMGAVYSVCGSATMTLAGDVLPVDKITQGISRFAFTISTGMAVGPYVGIQVQNYLSSKASFLTIFGITVAAFICVSCCRIQYPKVQRKKFSLRDSIYAPALPFMFNMMFLMIPYGAVIAYSSILAQEKGLTGVLPYFYIFLAAGFFFGLGYGILQPLFQSFVTGTTPAPQRGVANATYMLSYDVGIGIGSLLMGCLQETIGLPMGFALTAIAHLVGGLVFLSYVDRYYRKLKNAAQ